MNSLEAHLQFQLEQLNHWTTLLALIERRAVKPHDITTDDAIAFVKARIRDLKGQIELIEQR
jgi:hypothetical protein